MKFEAKDWMAITSVVSGSIGVGMIWLPLLFIFISIVFGVCAWNIHTTKENES